MGGSSLPGDLVNDYFAGALRLDLIRDYELPKSAGPDDLVIAASFSGNTEETLAAFQEGLNRRCKVLALSNGGKLEGACRASSVPWIKIPDCIQPRCASGYFFASLLTLFHRLGLIEDSPKALLADLEEFLSEIQDECEAKGRELVAALGDCVPIVYAPSNLGGVARIWKIKFNENSKIQSFYNVFPELNHNEMVGFTRLLMKPALLYLESNFMHPRILRRMDVMEELLGGQLPVLRVKLRGATPLRETFEALAIGDYASYHLAQRHGVDPTPVEMVETFKKKL